MQRRETRANAARGEIAAVLAGVERRLCLTLGALAEIEEALALTDMGELADRMRRLSAKDLSVVLGALLRGGGDDGAAACDADLFEAAQAVARTFEAALR